MKKVNIYNGATKRVKLYTGKNGVIVLPAIVLSGIIRASGKAYVDVLAAGLAYARRNAGSSAIVQVNASGAVSIGKWAYADAVVDISTTSVARVLRSVSADAIVAITASASGTILGSEPGANAFIEMLAAGFAYAQRNAGSTATIEVDSTGSMYVAARAAANAGVDVIAVGNAYLLMQSGTAGSIVVNADGDAYALRHANAAAFAALLAEGSGTVTAGGGGGIDTINLIARWPLTEGSGANAIDVIGGYNGTLNGSATWGTDYAAFDGNNSGYIDTNEATAFYFGTQSFSICFWMKAFAADKGVLGNAASGGGSFLGYGTYVYPNSGSYQGINMFSRGTAGIVKDVAFGNNGNVADGNWHHVVLKFVRSGSGSTATMAFEIDIDGSSISAGGGGHYGDPSAEVMGDISTTGNFLIGTNPYYLGLGGLNFNGHLSDVRIYSEQISTARSAAIYAQGLP